MVVVDCLEAAGGFEAAACVATFLCAQDPDETLKRKTLDLSHRPVLSTTVGESYRNGRFHLIGPGSLE